MRCTTELQPIASGAARRRWRCQRRLPLVRGCRGDWGAACGGRRLPVVRGCRGELLAEGGAAAVGSGGATSRPRWVAASSGRRCYLRERRCCKPASTGCCKLGATVLPARAALLQAGVDSADIADVAASERWRCCQPGAALMPALLQGAAAVATWSWRHCYHGMASLLPATAGVATKACRGCYQLLHRLRRLGFSGEGRCQRRSDGGAH